MKKSFSLSMIISIFCFFTPKENSFGQEVVCEREIELLNNSRDKVSVDKVRWNKNGSLTLFAFTQVEQSGEAGNFRYEPVLVVYELSDSLQVQKKVEEKVRPFYSQTPKGGRKESPGTGKAGLTSAGEAKNGTAGSAYPDFFPASGKGDEIFSAADYLMERPLVSHTRLQYEYDWFSNSFKVVKQEERKFLLDVVVPAEGAFFIHDRILTNNQHRQVSLVTGNKLEEEDQTFHHYLEQTLYLCSVEGKQLAKHSLSFDFPMELRLHQFVLDETGNHQGVVFLYGAARRFGHYIGHANPTDYKVMFLDKYGEKAFKHSFTYGSEGCASEPIFAAVHRESLYVLGKGVGKEHDYHLMVFGQEGLLNLSRISQDMLYAQTVGAYKEGINKKFNSRFSPQGYQVLENGEIVFYGEHQVIMESARFDPETNSQLPPVSQYISYSFLHFDRDGNFLKNYVISKEAGSNLHKSAKINFLSSKDGQLRFLLSEPQKGEAKLPPHQLFSTGMGGMKIRKRYGDEETVPVVVKLELNQAKMSCLRFPEEIVNFQSENHFLMDSVKNELLLLTTSRQSELPVKLFLKKVRL